MQPRSTCCSIARLLEAVPNYDEARAFYRVAISIRSRALGEDHPDVGQGGVYDRKGGERGMVWSDKIFVRRDFSEKFEKCCKAESSAKFEFGKIYRF